MPPQIDVKSTPPFTHQDSDRQIANQLALAVNGDSLRSISRSTGYNPETTRRYMRGESRIPADFVRQIALRYQFDVRDLLTIPKNIQPITVPMETQNVDLRAFSTDKLINELGRRMTMVENCAVASVVVGQTLA